MRPASTHSAVRVRERACMRSRMPFISPVRVTVLVRSCASCSLRCLSRMPPSSPCTCRWQPEVYVYALPYCRMFQRSYGPSAEVSSHMLELMHAGPSQRSVR